MKNNLKVFNNKRILITGHAGLKGVAFTLV